MAGKIFVVAILLWQISCSAIPLEAQQKYWIYLNDKNSTNLALKDHSQFPGSLVFGEIKIESVVYSKWLNAVSSRLDSSTAELLRIQPGVDSVVALNQQLKYASTSADTAPKLRGYALEQINATAMLERGLDGDGIKIGIIDAGFYRADVQKSLSPIVDDGRLLGFRNYIDGDREPFTEMDSHGTRVWSLIGGYIPGTETYLGMAPQAEYFVARTDEDPAEYRAEEDYWVAAMEWMYENGVRIIHSSLGYSDGHDDPTEDYEPSDSDGKSSALTKIVNIAVYEKGLLVIMSAGNSGDEAFEVINIPADSPGVLAVGSTAMKFWTKQDYSSIGRYTFPIVKPDVACFATSGTSFSAPIISGLAACIMQADSTLSNIEIADLIRKSGNLRQFPNNFLGYGVPDAARILDMMKGDWGMEENSSLVTATSDEVILNILARNPVLFHKTDQYTVHRQQPLQRRTEKWKIKRPSKEIVRTTFSTNHEAIEIIWPEN